MTCCQVQKLAVMHTCMPLRQRASGRQGHLAWTRENLGATPYLLHGMEVAACGTHTCLHMSTSDSLDSVNAAGEGTVPGDVKALERSFLSCVAQGLGSPAGLREKAMP